MFALGTYEPLRPRNERILAHIRRGSLSARPCSAPTTWPTHRRRRSSIPLRLRRPRARCRCSAERRSRGIGESAYFSTFAGRGFYWFRLTGDEE